MRRPVAVAALVLGAVLALSAAAPALAASARTAALPAFRSCEALSAFGERGVDRVGPGRGSGVPFRAPASAPVALDPTPPIPVPPGSPVPTAAPVAAAPTAEDRSSAGAQEGTDYSGTNVQEQGVDEADLVKTDGRRLFVVAGGRLLAYDVRGTVPELRGSLDVDGSAHELLLRGDRLLVIAARGSSGDTVARSPAVGDTVATIAPSPLQLGTVITEIDVRDLAALKVARTMNVPGSYVSARRTSGTARIVLNTPADLAEDDGTPITDPALDDLVPRTVLKSEISGRTFTRRLVQCRDVRHPAAFSGLDLLTVLTVDLDRGLFNVDRDAVLAGAQVVYASTSSLYVASQRWYGAIEEAGDLPRQPVTEIHRFDITRPDETTYRSSGRVSGFVLNQFALSEHRGDLRVASTEEPLWLPGGEQRESESAVTVLRERAGRLVPVGRVGGLGRGERIYAVRFLGDVGYLVTFRQVDPLYTLDLADAERPRVLGELKITGYSAYLHPIGEDLVLGVGQEATAEGRRRGAQVSVFDVSDLRSPKRLQQRLLAPDAGDSTSAVEFDHRAFLWWPRTSTTVLPLDSYALDGATPFTGAVALRVRRAEGIEELGRVSHEDAGQSWTPQIRRSLVANGRLLTISDRGILSSGLERVESLGYAAFPRP